MFRSTVSFLDLTQTLVLKVLLITKKENPKNLLKSRNKTQTALPGDLIKANEELKPCSKANFKKALHPLMRYT